MSIVDEPTLMLEVEW